MESTSRRRKLDHMKKLIATLILIAGIAAQAEHVITIQITIPDRLEEDLESLLLTMPEHSDTNVVETTEEKVKRITAEVATAFWQRRLKKMKRTEHMKTVDDNVDDIEGE